MLDRIIGIAAISALALFLGVLIGFVRSPDLVAILAIVLAMAGYDFYRALFGNRRR